MYTSDHPTEMQNKSNHLLYAGLMGTSEIISVPNEFYSGTFMIQRK